MQTMLHFPLVWSFRDMVEADRLLLGEEAVSDIVRVLQLIYGKNKLHD